MRIIIIVVRRAIRRTMRRTISRTIRRTIRIAIRRSVRRTIRRTIRSIRGTILSYSNARGGPLPPFPQSEFTLKEIKKN